MTLQNNDRAILEATNISEDQWLNVLFLLSDTQTWIEEMHVSLMYQLPVNNRKKLLRKTYYLSATALAHLLERHYYKIHRHPHTGKFTIPIATIVSCIRDAALEPTVPVPNSCNVQRVFNTGQDIGFDRRGKSTCIITVVSDMA